MVEHIAEVKKGYITVIKRQIIFSLEKKIRIKNLQFDFLCVLENLAELIEALYGVTETRVGKHWCKVF